MLVAFLITVLILGLAFMMGWAMLQLINRKQMSLTPAPINWRFQYRRVPRHYRRQRRLDWPFYQ